MNSVCNCNKQKQNATVYCYVSGYWVTNKHKANLIELNVLYVYSLIHSWHIY